LVRKSKRLATEAIAIKIAARRSTQKKTSRIAAIPMTT
jgi:hypothetical protein